jgi:hypothetical protein
MCRSVAGLSPQAHKMAVHTMHNGRIMCGEFSL